jgi:acetylglutamate kinase
VTGPLVVKLGGELLESVRDRANVAAFVASVAPARAVVIIHGGGRAIDAELDRRGIAPKKIDGLRVTDQATLDVVMSVLAGTSNTELVAALVGQGVPAVGLTGVDAGMGRAIRSAAHRATNGATVDLGFVGDPTDVDTSLIELLIAHSYVPVVASIGLHETSDDGGSTLLNVNADVMACRIAAALPGADLVIAGGTAGVLDAHGTSIAALDLEGIDTVIASGTATAGMVAKLAACRTALLQGVATIRIVNGRTFDRSHGPEDAAGTTLTYVARDFSPAKTI